MVSSVFDSIVVMNLMIRSLQVYLHRPLSRLYHSPIEVSQYNTSTSVLLQGVMKNSEC